MQKSLEEKLNPLEPVIGENFNYNGKTYRAEKKSAACTGCCKEHDHCIGLMPPCSRLYRKDRTDIIFKEA